MKRKIGDKVERAKLCDCKEPKLTGSVCVGVYGYFRFCTGCQRECRIKFDADKLMEGTI